MTPQWQQGPTHFHSLGEPSGIPEQPMYVTLILVTWGQQSTSEKAPLSPRLFEHPSFVRRQQNGGVKVPLQAS